MGLAETKCETSNRADGDYESELTKGKPKEYLLREWSDKNIGCELQLEKSLADFLKAKFPDIQLEEEIDKIEAIEQLEDSDVEGSS